MSTHTPGPWSAGAMFASTFKDGHRLHGFPISGGGLAIARVWAGSVNTPMGEWSQETGAANARLIVAAPELLAEAQLMRCLATSLRFQSMTVADALTELARNGMPHDHGAAIAKATGEQA